MGADHLNRIPTSAGINAAVLSSICDRLGDTAARDSSGVPLLLHHGTFFTFDRFERTADIGFHFGSRRAAEARRRHEAPLPPRGSPARWRVVAACLRAANPLVLDVDPRSWSPTSLSNALRTSGHGEIADEIDECWPTWFRDHESRVTSAVDALLARKVAENPVWRDRVISLFRSKTSSVGNYAAPVAAPTEGGALLAAALRKWSSDFANLRLSMGRPAWLLQEPLRRRGFDSVCYRNAFEAKTERGLSWCVFSDTQIVQVGENLDQDILASRDAFFAAAIRLPTPTLTLPAPVPLGARDPQNCLPTRLDWKYFRGAMQQAVRASGKLELCDDDVGYPHRLLLRSRHSFYVFELRDWSGSLLRLSPGDDRATVVSNAIEWPNRETSAYYAEVVANLITADDEPGGGGARPGSGHIARSVSGWPTSRAIVSSHKGRLLRFCRAEAPTGNGYSNGVDVYVTTPRLPSIHWDSTPEGRQATIPCYALASSNPLVVPSLDPVYIRCHLKLQRRHGTDVSDIISHVISRGYDALVQAARPDDAKGCWWPLDARIVLPLPTNIAADTIPHDPAAGVLVGTNPLAQVRQANRVRRDARHTGSASMSL